MTTMSVVPAPGSERWREIYPVPPRLWLETVGPWCPLNDCQLQLRLDDSRPRVRPTGWGCRACGAAWDITGTRSWWPQAGQRPVSPARVAGVIAGCVAAAAGIAVPAAGLDEQLVLAVAAVPATAVAAIMLRALGGRIGDWRRYRHNRLITVYGADQHALPDGEVHDGR